MNTSRLMSLAGALILGAFLGLPRLSLAEPRTQEWNYSTPTNPASMPENFGGLKISVNNEVKTPDGQPSLDCVPDYNREDLEWPSHLRYPARAAMAREAKTAEITFWIKGEAGSRIALRLTNANASHYTATRSYDLTGEWQKIEFKEEIKGPVNGKWLSAPRLLLERAKGGQHFYIGPVTFKAID